MTIEREYRRRIYASYASSYYGEVAPTTLAGLAPRAPYLRKLINDHFPRERGVSVLDLGCGCGALIHVARELGYHNVRGVEGSQQQVAAAKQLGIAGVEHGELLERLRGCPDASEEVVIAFDVIEHFDRDELFAFADQVYRVLRTGGRFIIHTPNAESPFFGRIRYGDLTHEIAFTRNSLHQLLCAARFEPPKFFEDRPVVHGMLSAGRAVLWRVARAAMRLRIAIETGSFERDAVLSQNLLAVAVK
ncbi:MAG: class I SAM-dependent DNA methyltransferase [Candidatus Binataceae bacterium]